MVSIFLRIYFLPVSITKWQAKSTIFSFYAHKHPNDAKLLFATSICIKANMSY